MGNKGTTTELNDTVTVYQTDTENGRDRIVGIELWHKIKGEWMHIIQQVNDCGVLEMYTNGVKEE